MLGALEPNRTYWFAPGIHTLGPGAFAQVAPAHGDTFTGAPGAVLDGRSVNRYAFVGQATDVVVEHLTIEHFGARGGNQNAGVVNHDAATGWVMADDVVRDNAGAGVFLGSDDVLSSSCLADNGQYGFSAYRPGGVSEVVMAGNEITGNDTYNWEAADPGCGCSGGGKFWDTTDAVVVDNYVHDNASVGIWVDTDNSGFYIARNYISDNYSSGITYEVSYNAQIVNNTFVRNGLGSGPRTPGFPTGAVYVSGSGGDSRVPSSYGAELSVADNRFVNNWGGVVLWEDANRFCSDGSDGVCTLVNPQRYTLASCRMHLLGMSGPTNSDYFEGCRWRTQNVVVSKDTFDFDPADLGRRCTTANWCGMNGLLSEYGSFKPYQGWTVPLDVADHQGDVFEDNTYHGPWTFVGFDQGDRVGWTQWTKGFADDNGSHDTFAGQDAGSRYRA